MQPSETSVVRTASSIVRGRRRAQDRGGHLGAVGVVILAALHDAHPQLRLELSASDQLEDLLHRESDIAVRMVQPAQTALVVRRIGGIPVAMFAQRDYLARHGTPKTLVDLASHGVIGFDRETAYIRAMTKRYPALANLTFALRTDNNLAQLAAIRARRRHRDVPGRARRA